MYFIQIWVALESTKDNPIKDAQTDVTVTYDSDIENAKVHMLSESR